MVAFAYDYQYSIILLTFKVHILAFFEKGPRVD